MAVASVVLGWGLSLRGYGFLAQDRVATSVPLES